MGLFKSLSNIFDDALGLVGDIGEGVYDVGVGIVESVEASVKGALTGDPLAIASLALTIYAGYNLYSAFAASTGAAASTAATTTATTTASTSASASGGLSSLSNEAFADAILKAAETGTSEAFTSEAINKVAEESLKQTLAEVTITETGTDIAKKTLFETVSSIATSPLGEAAITLAPTALGALMTPEFEIPEYEPIAPSELFNVSPTVQTGSGGVRPTRGSVSESSDNFTNINVLGRLG